MHTDVKPKSQAQLYSAQDLNTLSFPETEEGLYAKEFLTAFMSHPTNHYISNINTTMYCLRVGDHFLPVTVNDTEYENSYVTSPFGVAVYAQEELKRFNHWFLTPAFLPVLKGAGECLKYANINRVVTVNNWLLATNLYPQLSQKQIADAVSLLETTFPTHTILWRSLNKTEPENLLNTFKELPCRLFFTRQVYLYDPAKKENLNSKQKWNIKTDQKLLKESGYQVVTGEELNNQDITRIRELYTYLYLDKYSSLNPQFTDDFIRLAIEKKLLHIRALKKEGRIDGVIGYLIKGNVMTAPLFGYDTHLPQKIGLYRMLTSLCMEEATRKGILLNHSSGASHFKRVRGMYPNHEYIAVFDQHLPKKRRMVWGMLTVLSNLLGKPILTRYKV